MNLNYEVCKNIYCTKTSNNIKHKKVIFFIQCCHKKLFLLLLLFYLVNLMMKIFIKIYSYLPVLSEVLLSFFRYCVNIFWHFTKLLQQERENESMQMGAKIQIKKFCFRFKEKNLIAFAEYGRFIVNILELIKIMVNNSVCRWRTFNLE